MKKWNISIRKSFGAAFWEAPIENGIGIYFCNDKSINPVHSRGILARETGVVGPKVGKYSVDVGGFEKVAIASIGVDRKLPEGKRAYVIIDEVGI